MTTTENPIDIADTADGVIPPQMSADEALDSSTATTPADTDDPPDSPTKTAGEASTVPVLPTSAEEVKDFTLLYVDPDELVIGHNRRAFRPEDLDDDFVDDLADRGNYVPIIARFDWQGQLVVRDGQIRTHGLRKAKRTAVHRGQDSWHKALVLAQDHAITADRAAQLEDLVEQHGANFLRLAMTETDHLRFVQEALDLGVEPDKVGKKLRLKPADARTLVSVAQSTHAADLAHQGVLPIDETVVIAEFDGYGDTEAVAQLTEIARTNPRQLKNKAGQLRDARTERLALEAEAARLAERGVRVIERPDTISGPHIRQLADLRPTPRTKPGTALSVKRHSSCPGHAAYLLYRASTWHRPQDEVVVIHVCTDFQKHRHAERDAEPGKVLRPPAALSAIAGRRKGPMTAAEKAYRDTVIANGKKWDSATRERIASLETFAKRKSLPQAEDTWLAAMQATSARYAKAASKGHPLAQKLLGWDTKFAGLSDDKRRQAIRAEISTVKPERARVIAMVMGLAAQEQGVSRRTTWENPTDEDVAYVTKLRELEQAKLLDRALDEIEELVLNPAPPVDSAIVAAVDAENDTEAIADDSTIADTAPDPGDDGADDEAADDIGEPDPADAEHDQVTAPVEDGPRNLAA